VQEIGAELYRFILEGLVRRPAILCHPIDSRHHAGAMPASDGARTPVDVPDR
jgi:hypothetical protein